MTDELLTKDYPLSEVAESVGMSERWVRQKIKDNDLEHIRRGHKIFFDEAQLAVLKSLGRTGGAAKSITTGRKKRSA